MMKTVHVVCGLAIRDGLVLMGKRKSNLKRPDLWEHPGGKLKDGESIEEALIREWKEELDTNIKVEESISRVAIQFEERALIDLYHIQFEGEPKIVDSHSDLKWVDPMHAVQYMPLSPSSYLFHQYIMKFLHKNSSP